MNMTSVQQQYPLRATTIRLKFGQQAFTYAAPAAWNSLPPSLQELSDTALFKRNLKTLPFQRAFYL